MSEFRFAKSSYSQDGMECVEVALNIPETAAVRDSKDPGGDPEVRMLRVAAPAWSAFTDFVTR